MCTYEDRILARTPRRTPRSLIIYFLLPAPATLYAKALETMPDFENLRRDSRGGFFVEYHRMHRKTEYGRSAGVPDVEPSAHLVVNSKVL